jgi:hypothetical protein
METGEGFDDFGDAASQRISVFMLAGVQHVDHE